MLTCGQEQLEAARIRFVKAQRAGDFAGAGELQYSIIPDLEKAANAQAPSSRLVADRVSADSIYEVVSHTTAIPVANLKKSEKERLLTMESHLRQVSRGVCREPNPLQRVVSQDEAVKAVATAVRLSRTGLSSEGRPTGSLLFVGPSGVGKTEICKALAEFLFDDDKAVTRIDMSEYQEKHSLSRLVGAPPGYIGYEEGGVLTEAVRRRPFRVVLFDEIEKGHRDVLNLLLQVPWRRRVQGLDLAQIMDEGFCTDSQGHRVDFSNTLVVLTSNIGSDMWQELAHSSMESAELTKTAAVVEERVRGAFPPELINRLDRIVVFKPLTLESMEGVVDVHVRRLAAGLLKKGITLHVGWGMHEVCLTVGAGVGARQDGACHQELRSEVRCTAAAPHARDGGAGADLDAHPQPPG